MPPPVHESQVAFSGRNLAELRKAAGLSQMALAVAIGANFESIGGWERNLRAPRANHLGALVGVLGCSMDDLFEPVTKNAPTGGRTRSGASASGGTRHVES